VGIVVIVMLLSHQVGQMAQDCQLQGDTMGKAASGLCITPAKNDTAAIEGMLSTSALALGQRSQNSTQPMPAWFL
jgi:hypothetical protein